MSFESQNHDSRLRLSALSFSKGPKTGREGIGRDGPRKR